MKIGAVTSWTLTILLIVTLLLQPASAQCPSHVAEGRVVIVAVSQLSNGSLVGTSADLYVKVECPGSGRVYVETVPLTQIDTQASARVAAQVAARVAGIPMAACDYMISIVSDSPIIGGPSASGVTAVALAAALMGLDLRGDVVMTGAILPDGSIGPVGGLKEKLEAAASRGAKTFLIPNGQRVDIEYVTTTERVGGWIIVRTVPQQIDLVEYGRSLGVDVVEVKNVYEALHYMTGGRYRPPTEAGLNLSEVLRGSSRLLSSWIDELNSTLIDVWAKTNTTAANIRSRTLQPYIEQIQAAITSQYRSALDGVSGGRLYDAASALFRALGYAYALYHLGIYYVNGSAAYSSRIEEIYGNITQFLDEASSLSYSIQSLPAAFIAVDRVYEALSYLSTARSYVVPDAFIYSGFAEARLMTARLWLRLAADLSSAGGTVSSDTLPRLAEYTTTYARNYIDYVLALQTSTGTSTVGGIDAALNYYNMSIHEDRPLLRTALALKSASYAYIALAQLYSAAGIQPLFESLNTTISTTLELLSERGVDVTPLAIQYTSLANSSADQAALSSLAYLSAISSTLLDLLLSTSQSASNLGPTTSTPAAQCVEGAATVTKTVTVTATRTMTTTETGIPAEAGGAYLYVGTLVLSTALNVALFAALLYFITRRGSPEMRSVG